MKKIIILTSVLLISTVFIAILYFSNLSVETHNNDKILALVPDETALIFQFKNDKSLNDVFKDYDLFNTVLGAQRVAEISQLQQLLLKQPQFDEASENQNVFLSFYPEKDSVDLLWAVALNNKISSADVHDLLLQPSNDISAKEITISNEDVLEIKIKPLNKIFYLFISKGFATGSFSKALLQKFLDKNSPKISKEFINEINISAQKNENSPFNIFINHNSALSFLSNFMRSKPDGNFLLLDQLKGFSILNMNFKSDAFMFNGIGKVDTGSANYLNLFLHQKPVPASIKKTFPANISDFIAFGLSDYTRFHSDLRTLLQKRNELSKLTAQMNRLEQKYGFNIEADIKRLWSNEFAVLALPSNEKIAVLKLANGMQMKSLLESLSSVRTSDVREFNDSNILYYYFGDPLKTFTRPYFTVIDNYLIAGNNTRTVEDFAASYRADKLLYKTLGFSEFNQFVANQSNVMFFIHNKNSTSLLKNILKTNYARVFSEENSGYKNFYGFCYQWSAYQDHFFIDLYSNYTSTQTEKLELAWKFHLNGRLAVSPQILPGINNEKLILIQDNINNLYLLSSEGKKIWSRQLPERIMGIVHQLADNTILFNTSKHIYRMDLHGNPYKGFPVKLSRPASYGLTVTDNDPGKLKIFIPCSNQIAGFYASGVAISGWNKTLNGKILYDLKITNLDKTNYVIAGTENGQFYFYNYNGAVIGKTADRDKRYFNNPLALDIKSSTGDSRILTTDTTGSVRSILFNGNILEKNIGFWSGAHFFDAKNITGDQDPELIYLDKNQLYVYTSDSTLVFNYNFETTITNRPQYFPVNQYAYQIGVSSAENDLLYLFNDDGNLVKGFPVNGIPNFFVGALHNDGFRYLICGDSKNYLYVYKL
jgi:hypothetical protein